MKTLKKLEIEFVILIEKLKENQISLKKALIIFERLIDDFECLSEKEINAIDELRKEFKRLTKQIVRIKEIESSIENLENVIQFYQKKHML